LHDDTRRQGSASCFSRWIFARLLGAIFCGAFLSLAVQVRGLFGERGIAPAADFLRAAQAQLGTAAYWKVPTLCWLGASDAELMGLCWAGVVVSLVLVAGVCPGFCALLLWAIYLSLCSVGSPFLNFQWDILLTETAFLAIFALPWRWRPDWQQPTRVARLAWLLLWWLAFRLMFESGVVKLTSGDPTWRNLTALAYHFETQPLPLPTAWYAHQLPAVILRAITGVMFLIELAAPFLIFAPRHWRHAGALALIGLQVGILLTGNYAFFNLLSIALCLTLFDNAAWPARWRQRLLPVTAQPVREWRWTLWLFTPIAFVIVLTTSTQLEASLHQRDDWKPGWHPTVTTLLEAAHPWRSTNGYGLFRVMTTTRPEVAIEGSNDGVNWQEYGFRYKAGDLRQRPRLAAPHQPRLDWQMWFAALGDVRQNPWFVNTLARLLEGSPDVLALFEMNPFPAQPPRQIRAVLYQYRFTDFDEPTAAWWQRKMLGIYCPPLSITRERSADGGGKENPGR
jgi:hypothetical protein